MSGAETLAPGLVLLGLFLIFLPVMSAEQNWARGLVVGIAGVVMLRYLVWRLDETVLPLDFDSAQGIWILMVFVIEALAFADTALSFFMMSRYANRSVEADRHEARLRAMPDDRLRSVDVFIPTFNEDLEVLERTIVGALNIDYPRMTVSVLDDGKRDWLRDFCEEKGARYIRRPTNEHAKAGNINYALGVTDADLVAIFDADFVPNRNYLYRTVGFFDETHIGCVQTPQHFFNKDPVQLNLGLDRHWPEEQRFFFDNVLPSRDAWNCAFCCGSGSITRRSALATMGGVPTDSITEDILSTLVLMRQGYITRYLNERLSLGLSPESTEAFFVQRKRWCRGAIQLLYLRDGPLGPGLGLLQRLFFFPSYWLIQLTTRIAIFLIPLVYMFTGLTPLRLATMSDLVYYQLPVFVTYLMAMRWLAPNSYLPLLMTAANLFVAIRTVPTAIASLIWPFGVPFKVTPKGGDNQTGVYDKTTFTVAGGLLLATIAGLVVNTVPETRIIRDSGFFPVAAMWAILNVVILFLVVLLCFEVPRKRKQERFELNEAVQYALGDRRALCQIIDISFTGARLSFGNHPAPDVGEPVFVEFHGVGQLRGRVVRADGVSAGVQFEGLDSTARDKLSALIADLSCREPEQRRKSPRIDIREQAECISGDVWSRCELLDASLSGAMLDFGDQPTPAQGDFISLDMRGVGMLHAEVMRVWQSRVGLRFDDVNAEARDRLIRRLYTEGLQANVDNAAGAKLITMKLLSRAFGRSPA